MVQLQFVEDGHRAGDVQAWLDERFPHLQAHAAANPGLCVEFTLPAEHFDSGSGPYVRLMEATASLDLALEILDECFRQLEIAEPEVLSVHLTRTL